MKPVYFRTAEDVYYYVRMTRERWDEAEKVISTSAEWSYHYALNILKNKFDIYRFKMGEKEIAKNIFLCEEYCLKVIEGLVPLDFLELCQVEVLEHLVICDIKNKYDIVKILFKKKLLGYE